MDTNSFTLDGSDRQWRAVRFGNPWNGFLTPVVARETLENILDSLEDGRRWEGDVAVVWPTIDMVPGEEPDPKTEDRVVPDSEGNYDLGVLGWTFVGA